MFIIIVVVVVVVVIVIVIQYIFVETVSLQSHTAAYLQGSFAAK